MKKLAILVVLTLCCFTGFAKDPESKTFLALFKPSELKNHKTNLKSIETQFSSFFSTKTYDGNSELALIIEIPSCEFDACFLGEFLVNVGEGQKIQLQNSHLKNVNTTTGLRLEKRFNVHLHLNEF